MPFPFNPDGSLQIAVAANITPISALSVDVQSFDSPVNAQRSHFFRVRDISVAPPNGLTHFLIRGDGNVGIGTITPANKLHVHGSSKDFALTFTNNANTVGKRGYRIAFGNDLLAFQQADDSGGYVANQVAITQDTGNVGIGTITPSASLSVVSHGATEIVGTAHSSTFRTSAGNLGTTQANELSLASIGFHAGGNSVSLGIRARRLVSVADAGWTSTALVLSMDVDNTPAVNNAILALNASGNVGIGTTSPSYPLDVASAHAAPTTNASMGLSVKDSTPMAAGVGGRLGFVGQYQVPQYPQAVAYAEFGAIAGIKANGMFGDVSGQLAFYTRAGGSGNWGSPKVLIDQTGNVGIGTTNPANRLHLHGNSGNHALTFTNAMNSVGKRGYRIAFDNDRLTFQQADDAGNFQVNHVAIAADTGNVGIGTTNPGWPLDVKSASGIKLGLEGSGGGQLILANNPNDNSIYLEAWSADGLGNAAELFLTGKWGQQVPKMSFQAINTAISGSLIVAGNVGIGPNAPQHMLHISGGGEVRIEGSATPGGTALSLGGYGDFSIDAPGQPGGRFIVQDGGNVGIGTTTPSAKLEVKGDVKVSGDIFLTSADCAEDFDVGDAQAVEPGTVLVLTADGTLGVSQHPYDKKVAGVVSGAGDFKPGLTLDHHPTRAGRAPVALLGKVFCMVDASFAPIEVGDLLTTSPTPGHGMKASDPTRAYGSVFGRALRPLGAGQDLIPILVGRQ